MDKTTKFFMWILGTMAILNVIADLWFRISISGATGAPWYVWGAVIGTMMLVVLALIAQKFLMGAQKKQAEATNVGSKNT